MTQTLALSNAKLSDADAIADLLNHAYRGSQGWTTEGHLVSGERIDSENVQRTIQAHDHDFLVLRRDNELVACIALQYSQQNNLSCAGIGCFAVAPEHQSSGLGKAVLRAAEKHAQTQQGVKLFTMIVIAERLELIAYYERRGYHQTGQINPYPVAEHSGLPVHKDLMVITMQKLISGKF